MSAGPPLGYSWPIDVGNNPNINRDPPPPPFGAPVSQPAPAPAPAAAAGPAQVLVQEQHQNAVYGPPLPIGIAPPLGLGIGAFPPVFPPLGIMDPLLMGGGFVPAGSGPLAPIRAGNFIPNAQYGIGFGLHANGVPIPPPPPGAMPGVIPPFAPAAPLWTAGAGLAFGNVPAAGVVPAMMPMMGGMMSQHHRPAPLIHDGNLGHNAQPAQTDHSTIPGGIPAGVMLVESAEHTIFMRITGNVCPWLSPGATLGIEQLAAPSSTALNRLIEICHDGVPEDQLENTAITECIELGNGLWEKGQTFRYNDAVSKVLTMKDAGWDNTRNRVGGNSLHLWGHRV
ncbi:rna-metabolising metallo-beta-lactamase protein [Curvularia clavata]|uniref:Rna-metabolising metallo-beta-lactamase protein n=1 Tax=Curvularia clavata TaxID=95742 RepID=A0A9Q8Z750_CURCL|nr:rna-metabolising metallo-beta-lactamase protein [Curvularia clavata]